MVGSDELHRLIDESIKTCKELKEENVYSCTSIYQETNQHRWLYLNSDRAPLEQIFKSEYSKDDRMKKKDTDCLRIGDLVVARWAEDLQLYRAKIEKINQKKLVVRFVDYGNVSEVAPASLFYYHEALNKIPFQAFNYDLIETSRNERKNIFMRILTLKSFHCRIESVDMQRIPQAYISVIIEDKPSSVQVIHQNKTEFEVNPMSVEKVAEWIKKHKFVSEVDRSVSEDEYFTDADSRNADEVSEDCFMLGNDLFDFPDRPSTSTSSVYMSGPRDSPDPNQTDGNCVKLTNNVKNRDVICLDWLFPSAMEGEFQCSLFETAEHFYMLKRSSLKTKETIELMLQMQNTTNSSPDNKKIENTCWGIRVGQNWRRVRIIQRVNDTVSLKMIDTGAEISADVGELVWLPEGLPSETPALALRCSLLVTKINTETAKIFIKQTETVRVLILDFTNDTFFIDVELEELGVTLTTLMKNLELVNEVDVSTDDEHSEVSDDWSYMADDFYARTNTFETQDDDVEVALRGYSVKEDLCQKFSLYRHCPKGGFCDKKHADSDEDMKTLDVSYRDQDQLKVDEALYVHLVDISKIPILTMRQSSVTYHSNNFTLKDIQERVGCVQNPTLNRALEVETGKVVGIQLPEYGWVRAKILDCVEDHRKDKLIMYLVDYGKTVRFSPNTYQLKELDTDTQDIPFFAVECALKGWLDDPQIYREKLLKFVQGHVEEELRIRVIETVENVNVIILYRKIKTSWSPLVM